MNTDNTTNIQAIDARLGAMLNEAKNILLEINKDKDEFNSRFDDIEARVDESVNKLEKIYSDLDRAEKEASDKLDNLILRQAEDLAEE